MQSRFTWLLPLVLFLPTSAADAQSRACPNTPPAGSDFSQVVQEVKLTILRVEFPRDFPLPEDTQAKLEHEIRSQDLSAAPEALDSDWWENYVDLGIREELRAKGYFKANVHSRPYLVRAKADELEYIVAVEGQSGPRYRLRRLQFRSADPDGELHVHAGELQDIFPLRSGDIFDVSKVRACLEAFGKLYGRTGYIDFTPAPDTTVDEQNHQIDLVVNIDEHLQYRVAKVELLGLDSQTTKSLESLIEPGQIFNRASFEALFKEHESLLPPNSSPDRNAAITRNQKDATIDIVLDFRPCPQILSVQPAQSRLRLRLEPEP